MHGDVSGSVSVVHIDDSSGNTLLDVSESAFIGGCTHDLQVQQRYFTGELQSISDRSLLFITLLMNEQPWVISKK